MATWADVHASATRSASKDSRGERTARSASFGGRAAVVGPTGVHYHTHTHTHTHTRAALCECMIPLLPTPVGR
jgi:hypothetical protein